MSLIKSPAEIRVLQEGGEILSRALRAAMRSCVVGAETGDIDAEARRVIEEAGGRPSFLGYRITAEDPAFPSTLCISLNEEVVHGPATPSRVIRDGDIVGLDIGAWYKGLATDMATTVIVGRVPPHVEGLVRDTRESLVRGLSAIHAGATIMEIGGAIEDYLTPKKYGIVRDLVGHGVGHAVHEEPQVPNFRDRRTPNLRLQAGMVLAIEPMVTLGDWHVGMKDDGWTIVTEDHSLAAHFEVTIAVTDEGYTLLTPWPDVAV